MKRILLLAFVLLSVLPAGAQTWKNMDKYPNYKDFSIPKPDGVNIAKSDLKLTDSFLDLYPDGTPTLSREGLGKMYEFYRNDPSGRKEWSSLVNAAFNVVSSWDIRKGASGFGTRRYIYSLSVLKKLSTVYMFTGCEAVSLFIRGHLAKAASLPIDFWVHAELRGLDPRHPKGCLETAQLNEMLGFALAACRKDMTADEISAIETAWREMGHKTAFNWLDKFKSNNWTAVIGCGLLYSSKYFGDEVAQRRALDALKFYADTTIGPDGSYGEGFAYFTYPAGELVKASLVMTPEEIASTFGESNYRGTMVWRLYGMLLDVDESGKPGTMRINYGDNSYGDSSIANGAATMFSEIAFRDGTAAWARDRWGRRMSSDEVILRSKFPGGDVTPTSPSEAGLPLLKIFDSGDCFFHSSWDDNAIVLGLKSGDHGGRVGHSHSRPELNSLTLGAFGEYIIVACGSASYRSRLYAEHDLCAPAFNNISIDGMNQLSYRGPSVKEGRWDNSAVWAKGEPVGIVTKSEVGDDGSMEFTSDVTRAYHIPMKEAARTVRYVAEGGFFIVTDRFVPEDGGTHRYDYRFNIFNRDFKTVVSGKPVSLKIERGAADLYIALDCNSKLTLSKNEGYLHSPKGRDYDEGGPLTGKPGSAIELDWSTTSRDLVISAVLFPRPSGSPAPKIKFSKGKVTVDGKAYEITK